MAKIAIGADHGGFELKEFLISKFQETEQDTNFEIVDCGIYSLERADYPDVAQEVCQKINNGEALLGILICGTGIGISIAANKIRGIRCGLAAEPYSGRMAHEHNNCNCIALGGRTTGPELAWDIVLAFLNASFQGGRHKIRVDKIMDLEEKGC